MLEITIDNSYKCDLETITDPNNSQYFWINRRDLEIEIKHIFDKYKDLLTQKYSKATNLEFLKLKEKLGLCRYEDICDEQELISMSEEKIITQHDVENKQLKEENEKVRKEENEKVTKEEN